VKPPRTEGGTAGRPGLRQGSEAPVGRALRARRSAWGSENSTRLPTRLPTKGCRRVLVCPARTAANEQEYSHKEHKDHKENAGPSCVLCVLLRPSCLLPTAHCLLPLSLSIRGTALPSVVHYSFPPIFLSTPSRSPFVSLALRSLGEVGFVCFVVNLPRCLPLPSPMILSHMILSVQDARCPTPG